MITFISDALFILYIFAFLWRQFPFINISGQRKGEEKYSNYTNRSCIFNVLFL